MAARARRQRARPRRSSPSRGRSPQPRRGLTFSPGVVVAALVTVVVLAVGAYLTVQVMRFNKPPTLAVTAPRVATLTARRATRTRTSCAGRRSPAARSRSRSPACPRQTTADSTGAWSMDVDLRRGKNQFKIWATDPETGKQSEETAQVVITVPFAEIEVPTLTVDQPADGATVENGAIPVQGTATNATSVVGHRHATTDRPTARRRRRPVPARPPAPAPVTVDGRRGRHVQRRRSSSTTGRWSIVVTATGAANKTASITRHVAVAYKGVNLVVEVKGGPAWLKVWVDGKLASGLGRRDRRRRARSSRSRRTPRSRSGPARPGRRSSRSTASRSARSGSAASPRRGCSSRPPRRRRPSTSSVAGDPLVGLAERLQGICLGRGLTVALAESCTGGLVADAITDVAGSSGYFAGGVVSYSNEAKERAARRRRRPSSRPTARSAPRWRGRWRRARGSGSGRRVAASVTGIAGPDGGIGREAGRADVRRPSPTTTASTSGATVWSGDRAANKRSSAARRARAAARAGRGDAAAAAARASRSVTGAASIGAGLGARPRRRGRSAPGERIHVVGVAGAGASAAALHAALGRRRGERLRSGRPVAVHGRARGGRHRARLGARPVARRRGRRRRTGSR